MLMQQRQRATYLQGVGLATQGYHDWSIHTVKHGVRCKEIRAR